METLPSRPWDDHRVEVTLSPVLAKEVARSLRIRLACELDRPLEEPLPNRQDAARLRTVLDLCVDQLEALAWGEPAEEVRMVAPRRLLEEIAQDLLDGGNERLANPLGWNTPEAQRVRRQARRMIRAADAINGALASDPEYQLAS
ncbi:MAG TPA: hypothetical protein VMJ65_27480 [Solirubrobacteraceae bacterium]|nr:hypothetical protein [Solirubrobacteraceae bacterium]